MRCYCCTAEVPIARKVKLRPAPTGEERFTDPASAAYQSYRENMTYRWAVICISCYRALDNYCGVADIGAKTFNIAGTSRGDKAAVVDEAKYQAFRRREAEKMGLDG